MLVLCDGLVLIIQKYQNIVKSRAQRLTMLKVKLIFNRIHTFEVMHTLQTGFPEKKFPKNPKLKKVFCKKEK